MHCALDWAVPRSGNEGPGGLFQDIYHSKVHHRFSAGVFIHLLGIKAVS
jgi:hypothetical protein